MQEQEKPSYEYQVPIPTRSSVEKMLFYNKYFWYFGWGLFLYFICIWYFRYWLFLNQDVGVTIKIIYLLLLFVSSLMLVKNVNYEFNTIKAFFVIYNYLFNQWKNFANIWLSKDEQIKRTHSVKMIDLSKGYERQTPSSINPF